MLIMPQTQNSGKINVSRETVERQTLFICPKVRCGQKPHENQWESGNRNVLEGEFLDSDHVPAKWTTDSGKTKRADIGIARDSESVARLPNRHSGIPDAFQS